MKQGRRQWRIVQGANVCAVLLTIAAARAAVARPDQTPAQPVMVSTSWLAEHLRDPSLVLLHAGTQAAYDAAHIAGARFVSVAELTTKGPTGLSMEMPPLADLQTTVERLGITDERRVVVYYEGDGARTAARVYLTLDYLGLGGRISVLDGGLQAWQSEARPVTTDVAPPVRSTFAARPRTDLLVEADWLSTALTTPGIVMIDARAPEYFAGKDAETIRYPRPGRIPGAKNLPFNTLTDAAAKLKDDSTLRQLFLESGAAPGTVVVTYCHIGLQASLVYLAARHLGYTARFYDGAFEDWSRREDLPVER
jgi:thiosulfate/3-mercaptopyruvate sulfurtransferase